MDGVPVRRGLQCPIGADRDRSTSPFDRPEWVECDSERVLRPLTYYFKLENQVRGARRTLLSQGGVGTPVFPRTGPLVGSGPLDVRPE